MRIDLARSVGTDFEQIVLTIRAALTRIGRPLPAFDLALRRYWEANHPGEPLEEYLRRGGLGSRFGQVLPQQMQSALADVAQALMLPGTIGSVVGQVTGALVGALRERRQAVRAPAGCARLAVGARPTPRGQTRRAGRPDEGLSAAGGAAGCDMDRAAAAYAAARDEAEHHGVTGERGNSQAHRAFALAFTDPAVADDELALAEQLLAGVDLRATTLITHIATLARDAGPPMPTSTTAPRCCVLRSVQRA
ncbi:hypothetical protein [Streptomyces sp. NPDC085596]|uniref:hypothetical protein n=1 Tax=Streptomyces sp. NPDC085596 TaxID=3365731 RepID=UPI0037D39331